MKVPSPFFLIVALAFNVSVVSASSNQPVDSSLLLTRKKTTNPKTHGFDLNLCRSVSRGGQSVSRSFPLSTKAAVLSGMLLAFNSGYVNGACLSGILHSNNVKQASAAVTGAWTNSALGFASGNRGQFIFNTKCILSYLTGSAIASLLNPNPVPFSVSRNNVSPAFLIGAALLYGSSNIAGKKGLSDNTSFIFLAAIANGIQNSITSTTTSNLVRSAHFSGITSDMGTFLGQVLRGNKQNLMKLKVFAALGASFWVGGAASYLATQKFESGSLLFSAALYLLIGLGIKLF
eukprot:CAMPEP_0197438634 /NCGR_PEP_ID=MMETSP1175-20131217/5559_1 /TAXON_ID=1003142 /ORGANISM="Triceratium dubium, Strain CCMP147" /LENGTH=289 /DNA_ID=CAMNT_0042968393 /DNA_START=46 /DNA_END=915 /DNA_ORIENTATION=+